MGYTAKGNLTNTSLITNESKKPITIFKALKLFSSSNTHQALVGKKLPPASTLKTLTSNIVSEQVHTGVFIGLNYQVARLLR